MGPTSVLKQDPGPLGSADILTETYMSHCQKQLKWELQGLYYWLKGYQDFRPVLAWLTWSPLHAVPAGRSPSTGENSCRRLP